MLVASQQIAPPRRGQMFNLRVAGDAALQRSLHEDEDRWVKQTIADLAGVIRFFGKRK